MRNDGHVCTVRGRSPQGSEYRGLPHAPFAVRRAQARVPLLSLMQVTAITECPDVARSEEWRSGVSHLAVSNSRGEVVLIKI